MSYPILPYGRQYIDADDIEAVSATLRGDFLTQGPGVGAFEQALCEATGSPFATVVANGTAALHLANLALGVTAGSIGLTTPITFVATANSMRYAGASVALCDVDSETGLMTPDTVSSALEELETAGRLPTVLSPVDLGGLPVALPALRKIARQRGIKILHDAAHSLGATFTHEGGKYIVGDGSFADATTLSFHPVKHITCGEGGAILTPSPEVHQLLVDLRSHGIHRRPADMSRAADDPFVGGWYYEQATLGYNYRLPDINCALGLSQLKKLSGFIERRRRLARQYDEAFAEDSLAEFFTPVPQPSDRNSSYHLYIIRLRSRRDESQRDLAGRRKALYEFLHHHGIRAQVHYIPLHFHPDFEGRCWMPRGGLPGAEAFYASCLSLPLFPAMEGSDVERVVDSLRTYASSPMR